MLHHVLSLCVLTVLATGGWFSLRLGAQDPPRKPPVEEEDPTPRPIKKPLPVEEEDPTAKPVKKPIPVEEQDPAKPAKVQPRPSNKTVPTELLRDAQAPGLEEPIRKLYRDLAVPHDAVTLKDGTIKTVRPLTHYLGPGSGYQGPVVLRYVEDNPKLTGLAETVSRAKITAVRHYEEIALDRLKDFLKGDVSGSVLPELNTNVVPHERKLEAAEKVLAVALHFHQTSPDRKVGEDPGWKKLGDRLRSQLVETRLEQLRSFARGGNWEKALNVASRLREDPDDKVRQETGRLLAGLLEGSLKQRRYDEVHGRLRELEKAFPDNPAVRSIPQQLREQAQALLEKARQLDQQGQHGEAGDLVARAAKIWSRTPGLQDFQRRLSGDYPILGVGVRELPERMSPATAVTDPERWAVELIFESLLKPYRNADTGLTDYVPQLATGLPRLTPRGRAFQLDREAYWSNGQRVTEADVRLTVRLLRENAGTNLAPIGAGLLEKPTPDSDPSRVTLALRQGYPDPLSAMSFKVLPAATGLGKPLTDLADKEFARHPIGSGPYQLCAPDRDERERRAGAVVFEANPAYQRTDPRTGKVRGTPIQEIRFFRSENPPDDFGQGRLHLFINPPQNVLQALRSLVNIQALPNRRIYFLAVNHQKPALQNLAVRKAIAHAIDREAILKDVFRKHLEDLNPRPHRALNGPFPPDAWAGKASAASALHQPLLARQEAAGLKNVKLTLKYPRLNEGRIANPSYGAGAGVSEVEDACNRIKEQVQKETGIELELVPRTPHELREDVEVNHDYELAYYSYDYPNDLFCPAPLFNTTPQALGKNGGNFLGYQNDGELASDLYGATHHRHFEEIRASMQRIQTQLTEKMLFIPLWQLDTIVAFHRDLTTAHLDPLLVFPDVEHWQLRKR
jgi:ABC-type transport system substrate-binding protein